MSSARVSSLRSAESAFLSVLNGIRSSSVRRVGLKIALWSGSLILWFLMSEASARLAALFILVPTLLVTLVNRDANLRVFLCTALLHSAVHFFTAYDIEHMENTATLDLFIHLFMLREVYRINAPKFDGHRRLAAAFDVFASVLLALHLLAIVSSLTTTYHPGLLRLFAYISVGPTVGSALWASTVLFYDETDGRLLGRALLLQCVPTIVIYVAMLFTRNHYDELYSHNFFEVYFELPCIIAYVAHKTQSKYLYAPRVSKQAEDRLVSSAM